MLHDTSWRGLAQLRATFAENEQTFDYVFLLDVQRGDHSLLETWTCCEVWVPAENGSSPCLQLGI